MSMELVIAFLLGAAAYSSLVIGSDALRDWRARRRAEKAELEHLRAMVARLANAGGLEREERMRR